MTKLGFAKVASVASVVSLTVFGSACEGGAGTLDTGMATWEPAGSTIEGSTSSHEVGTRDREGAPVPQDGIEASAESVPGAKRGGTGGFQCAGTYRCSEAGDDDTSTITLTAAGGGCSFVDDGVTIVFGADGTIALGGKSVGTWTANGSDGFRATISTTTITCTKGADAAGGDTKASAGDAAPPSPGADAG